MIIALLALAFAMIACGLLAIFFGWEIVLVERGWTMVLAGTFAAASGALLLGITAVISKLAGIQDELARLQGGFEEEALASGTESTGFSLAALSGGLLGGLAFGKKKRDDEVAPLPDFAEDRIEEEAGAEDAVSRLANIKPPESIVPFKPGAPLESVPSNEEETPEVKVPDFLLADRLGDRGVEARISDVDEDLYASEPVREASKEPADESAEREETVTPAAWPEPEPVAAPVEEEAAPEPEPIEKAQEPRPATIIGTYNSGDNRYVMFSDGSIEAHTPRGVFHFKSLDELKEFIASGGESSSSTAT